MELTPLGRHVLAEQHVTRRRGQANKRQQTANDVAEKWGEALYWQQVVVV